MKEKNGTELHHLSRFVSDFSYENLNPGIIEKLKIHLLDSIGCAIGAFNGPPINYLKETSLQLGGSPQSSLIGTEIKTSVDRASQYLTALIRYLDFMDNFLAKHGTCHPSDNIGSLLAVCDYKDLSGKSFLEAMALSYNVQCRMIEVEPSMDLGFDHTTQLGYSIAAGISKLLKFNKTQTENAIAISGSTFNPLVVTRAPYTSQWKGILSSQIAFGTVNCCLLAEKGMTGPIDIFEGTGGYNDDFKIKNPAQWRDLQPDLYDKLVLKKHNAEVHTQSAVEAALFIKQEQNIEIKNIKCIVVETFKTAYDITGGGEYGPRDKVKTKEQADHSLPYIIAVALIDGQVKPEQYSEERIMRSDVQELLKRVEVKTRLPFSEPKKIMDKIDPYTRAYPEKLICMVKIQMNNGKEFSKELEGFPGFHTSPYGWSEVKQKYDELTAFLPADKREEIYETIKDFENRNVRTLIKLLSGINKD